MFRWPEREYRLALVGRLSYLDPLISTLLLMTFIGLLPTPAAWMGMALIILGVALPELSSFWLRRVR